eukprot:jgi/Chrpa1/24341/Chrysochromulina_OHIO_Genome00023054-RA
MGVAASFTGSSAPPWEILNETVGPADIVMLPPSPSSTPPASPLLPLSVVSRRLTREVWRTAATGTDRSSPGMPPIRSAGTVTAAATPVPESHEIGCAASALGERTFMVMLRLSEDSTTGSAMPLLGTITVARAAAVAARAICSTAALICSPALAEEAEPSEATINPKSEERPFVTAWAASGGSSCTDASIAANSVAAVAVADARSSAASSLILSPPRGKPMPTAVEAPEAAETVEVARVAVKAEVVRVVVRVV